MGPISCPPAAFSCWSFQIPCLVGINSSGPELAHLPALALPASALGAVAWIEPILLSPPPPPLLRLGLGAGWG